MYIFWFKYTVTDRDGWELSYKFSMIASSIAKANAKANMYLPEIKKKFSHIMPWRTESFELIKAEEI